MKSSERTFATRGNPMKMPTANWAGRGIRLSRCRRVRYRKSRPRCSRADRANKTHLKRFKCGVQQRAKVSGNCSPQNLPELGGGRLGVAGVGREAPGESLKAALRFLR